MFAAELLHMQRCACVFVCLHTVTPHMEKDILVSEENSLDNEAGTSTEVDSDSGEREREHERNEPLRKREWPLRECVSTPSYFSRIVD